MSKSRWKKRILFLLGIGSVFGGLFLLLFLSTQTVPEFYQQALDDPSVRPDVAEQVQERTEQLLRELQDLDDALIDTSESSERVEILTARECNSWLAYEFPKKVPAAQQQGVTDLRVQFSPGVIQFGCRLQSNRFSGIVSIEARPELHTPNELSIVILSARIGQVPLPVNRLLEDLQETSTKQGFDWKEIGVTWEQSNQSDRVGTFSIKSDLAEDIPWRVAEVNVLKDELQLTGERNPLETLAAEAKGQDSSSAELSN